MDGVEEIKDKKQTIAMIFRQQVPVEDVQFLTPPTNSFQVGINHRKKGIKLQPHVHRLDAPLTISDVQEILYVVSGKIQVNLFTTEGKKLTKKILTTGDSILLISGGHGVDFLEDSRLFEIKQGPYPGKEKAKRFV